MSFSRFVFLGTSSAVPRPGLRNVSSMLLQFASGSTTMIDCGEGTQHQLMRSSVKMGNIDNILLTHLHGDHCYGFFGLVHTLNMGGRTQPLNVYGPSGVEELVRSVLRLTGGWDAFELRITELIPDKEHSFDLRSSSNEFLVHVTACPMVHRLTAFGYVFKEAAQARVLDSSMAKQLGVMEGPDLGKLKSGLDVSLPDGRIVRSAEVTVSGRAARTVAILQDTSDSSSAVPHIQNCDLLIHEATYQASLREQAIQYGHSTTVMAAEVARAVKAKLLVLTHFSSRYGGAEETKFLREEAQGELSDTRVVLAEDFMELSGPAFATISSVAKPSS